jgi:hypothetical protein
MRAANCSQVFIPVIFMSAMASVLSVMIFSPSSTARLDKSFIAKRYSGAGNKTRNPVGEFSSRGQTAEQIQRFLDQWSG